MADFPPMTDKAAEAFADYVDLGPKRSLETLAAAYKLCTEPVPTKHIQTLKTWSSKYQWQARISDAVTESVARKLEEAAELDAETFFESSRKLHEAIRSAADHRDIISIRESVRKPVAKGATNVNVQLDVQISQIVEKIAEAEGLNDIERAEFQKDVEKYLAEVGS